MMPVRLYVHPDNVEAMRKGLRSLKARVAENMHVEFNPEYIPIEIVPCDFIPKGELTGLYVLPSGAKVKREDIRIVEGFVTYGPEDLRYLLYSGKVKVDIEMVAMMIDDMFPMDWIREAMAPPMSFSKWVDSFAGKRVGPWRP